MAKPTKGFKSCSRILMRVFDEIKTINEVEKEYLRKNKLNTQIICV